MSTGTNRKNLHNELKNLFRSFRYRNYRLFFSGQSLSLIGTWIQRIALPWLVYRMTGSPLWLGVVSFASQIPAFVLAPYSGVMIDRWNRYRVLVGTQVLAMFQALILALLYYTNVIQIWHIIILGIFLGVINAFDMPARQSMVINMVGKREDLGNAIALNSTMVNLARLVGPSIAGILIAVTSEGFCFLFNGVSFMFVILSLLMMKLSLQRAPRKKANVLEDFKLGFRYVFGFIPFRNVILLLALVSLMGAPYAVLMPVFAREILHGSSYTYGFLMGSSGIGALIGAIYLASRKKIPGLESVIPIAAFLFGVGLFSVSFSREMIVSCMFLCVTGFGMAVGMASSNTVIQTIVDEDKRGRVMSFYYMAFIGSMPFGSLILGGVADHIGAAYAIMIGGALCITGALIFALNLRKLKKLIIPVYRRLGILT